MGKNIVFMPECHSTNDLALQLCQQGPAAEGTVIITNHQTKGRGQRGNTWDAEPGQNLTFSIVLKPTFLPLSNQFFLNIFASLAVLDFLRDHVSENTCVKWPNDLIADEKKICGILIENHLRGMILEHVVAGFGVNINQQHFASGNPTSLRLLNGKQHDLAEMFGQIIKKIEARYLQLREGKYTSMKEEYIRNLYWLGERHLFSDHSRTFEGVIEGVGDSGRLMLNVNGEMLSFAMKEISFVK